MNVCGIIPVSALSPSASLAGAADGAVWFQEARPRVDAANHGLLVIDFTGIQLATVSWLREGALALCKYAAAIRPEVRLAAAGLSPLVREELEVALEATGTMLIAADLGSKSQLIHPLILGRADPALCDTLQAVEGQAEFDATFVCRALPGVGLSAANNRLAALEAKGILTSERRGRSRVYRPLLEDLRYGYRDDREGDRPVRAQAAEMPRPS